MNRDELFCNVFRMNKHTFTDHLEYSPNQVLSRHCGRALLQAQGLWIEQLGILLKENNTLKNASDVFLHKKHNSVSSFCQGASKVILKDFPLNFGLRTPT